jgi:ABC-type microcin C transport system duplicated ATPase subunit YejF
MQLIFQDPYTSLSPNLTVEELVGEGLLVHGLATRDERESKVAALLERTGLPPEARSRYPHQFSGGQRQRIAIARALAVEPELLIADEPVSALDASTQGQIVDLLLELRRERRLTLLWIDHDLSLVERIADRVAVMHEGTLVETAKTSDLFARPQHAYTQALLAAARH